MTVPAHTPPAAQRLPHLEAVLPYVLSLPALLVCIGILIPFLTAAWYSLHRYRLSQPWGYKFIWFDNYLAFFSDPKFWNTLQISLTYAATTVVLELLLGSASRCSSRSARR